MNPLPTLPPAALCVPTDLLQSHVELQCQLELMISLYGSQLQGTCPGLMKMIQENLIRSEKIRRASYRLPLAHLHFAELDLSDL